MEKEEQQWMQEGEKKEQPLRGRPPRRSTKIDNLGESKGAINVRVMPFPCPESFIGVEEDAEIKDLKICSNSTEIKEENGQESAPESSNGVNKNSNTNTEIGEEKVEQINQKYIYYDSEEGSRLTNEYPGTEHSTSEHSGPGKNLDSGLNITVQNLNIQKSSRLAINHRYEEVLKDDILSASGLRPSEISWEEQKDGFSNKKAISSADNNITEESVLEWSESEVARVIEKQNTHVLYCPNCCSCITRRVILRKRICPIPFSDTDYHDHDVVDISSDGSHSHAVNGYDPDTEPYISGCSSCFSLCNPTGNGSKLFQVAGDNSGYESKQDSQQAPSRYKKQYYPKYDSDKREKPVKRPNPFGLFGDKSGEERMQDSQKTLSRNKNQVHSMLPSATLFNPFRIFGNQREERMQGYDFPSEQSQMTSNQIIDVEEGPVACQSAQDIIVSIESVCTSETVIHAETRSSIGREVRGPEIVKSIVYGGLIELITSIGVMSSAAGGDAATLNIVAWGLANLIGGLFVIGHNLWDLKKEPPEEASNQVDGRVDKYRELLGRRQNFTLHATVALLSYLIFGLLPPVMYGFTFRKSDDRDLKLVAVTAASLLCIIVLSTGKAYVQRPPKSYIKTVVYYVCMGLVASGISFAVGNLTNRLLEKLGLFESSSTVTLPHLETESVKPMWASY